EQCCQSSTQRMPSNPNIYRILFRGVHLFHCLLNLQCLGFYSFHDSKIGTSRTRPSRSMRFREQRGIESFMHVAEQEGASITPLEQRIDKEILYIGWRGTFECYNDKVMLQTPKHPSKWPAETVQF